MNSTKKIMKLNIYSFLLSIKIPQLLLCHTYVYGIAIEYITEVDAQYGDPENKNDNTYSKTKKSKSQQCRNKAQLSFIDL